jgi:lipopolysaccharide transport system ATP-binding protein
MSEIALAIDDVSKKFRLYHERNQTLKAAVMRGRRVVAEEFWALRNITFDVKQGETFGLIGANGSGKSSLLKILARILVPDGGQVRATGRVSSMLEVGSGFHPELTGRENIFLNGAILGLKKKQVVALFDEIVEFSGIENFLDQPVKNYSSGMNVRLGFAVAIHTSPDILIVDEILAVGDGAFQDKSKAKFRELTRQGSTVVLVSHSLSQVREMCDRAAWIDAGSLRRVGPAAQVTREYEKDWERGERA